MPLRYVFIAAFLLNVFINLYALMVMPDTVAIHFGRGGWPDNWAAKEMHALLMLVVDVLVFLPLYFTPALIDRVPPRFLSLPYKRYWLQEANRGRAKQLLVGLMDEFGTVLFGFLFGIAVLALEANRSEPVRLNEGFFMVLFAAFMVYTVVWTIRLVVKLRPPRGA